VQVGSEWQVVCWIDSKVRARYENIKVAGSYYTVRNSILRYNEITTCVIAEKEPKIILIFLNFIL
jgi:hypothetical protein